MKQLILTLCLLSFIPIKAQEIHDFGGFYVGLDLNFHYLFGGAQVDGKETIGDGNKLAIGIVTGYRWHFSNGNLVGIEAQLNQPFGQFRNEENSDGTIVDYFIKLQSALQFSFGRAIGQSQEQAVMGYFAFNQTRFNIDINRPNGKFKQTDFENFGRLGIAIESAWSGSSSTRFQIGTSLDALPDTPNGIDLKGTQIHTF